MPLWQKCLGCHDQGPDFKEHFRDVHLNRLSTKEEVNAVANKYLEIVSFGSELQISFRCSSCSTLCSSTKLFIEHIEVNHLPVSLLVLINCTKKFTNNYPYNQIIFMLFLQQRCFQCGICGDGFKTESDLCEHGIDAHWEVVFNDATIAGGSFTSAETLPLNEKKVLLVKPNDICAQKPEAVKDIGTGGKLDSPKSRSNLPGDRKEKVFQDHISQETIEVENRSELEMDEPQDRKHSKQMRVFDEDNEFLETDGPKCTVPPTCGSGEESRTNSIIGTHTKSPSNKIDSSSINSGFADTKIASRHVYAMEEVEDEVFEYPTVVKNKESRPKESLERSHLLFKSQPDLQRHNSDTHEFKCGLCEEVLLSEDNLQNHMSLLHSCNKPHPPHNGIVNVRDHPSIPEPTYCTCRQGQGRGRMIACDNNLCPIEWFHFKCVQVTRKPRGNWYCPGCRGDKPSLMRSISTISTESSQVMALVSRRSMVDKGEDFVINESRLVEHGGLSAVAEKDGMVAAREGTNAKGMSKGASSQQSERISMHAGAKRGRGRPPKNRDLQSSSVALRHFGELAADGDGRNREVTRGEKEEAEVARKDTNAEQGCAKGILTTGCEPIQEVLGAPVAKRGRGRPPKNPEQQPPLSPVVSSKDDSNDNACSEASRSTRSNYCCTTCNFVTSSRTMLRKHTAANHPSEKTAMKACGVCGYKGRNEVVLKIHYRQMHSAR